MLILAWIIIVILFLLISNYYIYKTDSRTRKKAFLYAIITRLWLLLLNMRGTKLLGFKSEKSPKQTAKRYPH